MPAHPVDRHVHAQTQSDESVRESAVSTLSDDPFQFADPPVTALVFLPQRNSGYDHRDALPHHIRTQLRQSGIRKPAQSMEPDAKRLRLDAGKRPVLMLSHDVSFGPECCKSLTVFKSCGDPGECANVLLPGRATSKEALYDTFTKPQQERMDAAVTREWDKWNEFGVTKFQSEKQLIDIVKQNPHQRILWVLTKKVIQGKQEYKAMLVVKGCQGEKSYLRKLATAAQDGWAKTCSMLSQRISSRMESRDCYFCECRTEIRLQERSQGKCLWQLVQSTGREMRGVLGMCTARKCSKLVGLWSQGWNKVFTTCLHLMDLRLSRTHTSMIS